MRIAVTINAGSINEDFELPADIPIEKLLILLLHGLKNLSSSEFQNVSQIFLAHNGQGLFNTTKSLSDYSIMDGDFLDVVFVEAYNGNNRLL